MARANPGKQAADRPVGSLRLDDQLCFALYAASRSVVQLYRPLLADLGLTYPQYLVMLVLWERGTVPVKDLTEALQLDYGTLSPLLKRLQSAGFIERRRAADDERSVLVALTPAGEELRVSADRLPQTIVDSYDLSGSEFDALQMTLRRLAESVTTTAGDGD